MARPWRDAGLAVGLEQTSRDKQRARLHCRPTAPTSCDQPTGAYGAQGESIPRSGAEVPDNGSVRKRQEACRPAGAVLAALATTLALIAGMSGCGQDPGLPAEPTTPPAAPPGQRDQLAGLAAAAKDKRYVARYTLATDRRPD